MKRQSLSGRSAGVAGMGRGAETNGSRSASTRDRGGERVVEELASANRAQPRPAGFHLDGVCSAKEVVQKLASPRRYPSKG